jgi:bacteriocin-like protein
MNERSNDKLVTSKKRDITLTEEELAGVSGGDVKPTKPTVPTEQVSLAFGKLNFVYTP